MVLCANRSAILLGSGTMASIKPTYWALVAALGGTAFAFPAHAQNPWRGLIDLAPPPGEIEQVDTAATPPADTPEPDWSLLNADDSPTAKASLREKRSSLIVGSPSSSWTSNDSNGASALSVKQSVTPFWDTRVGADINVARQNAPRSAADAYRNQFGDGTAQAQSGGAAWAAATAPGVGSIWDKTAIEARVDPGADQTKLGTSLSKSVPIAGDQYSLTLQSGYNVIQQGSVPIIGFNGRHARSFETDQQARFNITDSGTSLLAGQTMATTDDRWLRKVGAEQKLFGGVSISGTISETLQGPANKSLTAGFKHSW